MKRLALLAIVFCSVSHPAFSSCDLTRYHWDCDIPLHIKPTKSAHSLVRCGSTYGYITEAQYDQLAHYHRENVNMSVSINDEFADGPCVPSGR